jgi:predicted GNAT family N-acyltransferase
MRSHAEEPAIADLTILTVPVFSPICNLAFALRREVFIVEQKVQDDEFDADDLTATHVVAIADGAVVGTLRIIVMDKHTKIGRVVVRRDMRGQGVAKAMLELALTLARARGETRFWLAAQADKLRVYESVGFVAYGEEFDDGSGIMHRAMKTY